MNINIPANVETILDKLHHSNYKAYIYGACIRDIQLGKEPINWDICTNALSSDLIVLFDEKDGFTSLPALKEYGTTIVIYNGESYRISTFKTGEARRFSDKLEEDLLHNDFTINSIAYNHQEGFIDPYNGIEDIKQKIIKCAGQPLDRINEDGVRMLRAVRFEAQLGISIHQSLLETVSLLKDKIISADPEKIVSELTQILLSEKPSKSIRRLLELGMLEQLIPEMIPTIGFDVHSSYHDKDVFEHTMAVLDYCMPNLVLRLAALLHDIDKPNCLTIDADGEGHCYGHASTSSDLSRTILSRLGFDSHTTDSVCALIKEHMNNYESISELSIKRLIRRIGPDNIDNLFDLQLANIKGSELSGKDSSRINNIRNKCWEVLSRKEPLTTKDLDIDGYDLIAAAYSPGTQIGEMLEYLLDKVIDNPALNRKDILLELLQKNFRP